MARSRKTSPPRVPGKAFDLAVAKKRHDEHEAGITFDVIDEQGAAYPSTTWTVAGPDSTRHRIAQSVFAKAYNDRVEALPVAQREDEESLALCDFEARLDRAAYISLGFTGFENDGATVPFSRENARAILAASSHIFSQVVIAGQTGVPFRVRSGGTS